MSADIHLIHRDLKKELKSHSSPSFNKLMNTGLVERHMKKADEALFGGALSGSMTETSNEVGPAAEGLTVASIMRAKAWLDADSGPRLVEWATSDTERVKRAIMADQTMTMKSRADLRKSLSMAFYGVPIVLDEEVPADVLVEMRDQHGNCLGRVTAS